VLATARGCTGSPGAEGDGPDEDLAKGTVRLAVLDLLGVGQLRPADERGRVEAGQAIATIGQTSSLERQRAS
jgi:hypothetical protein